MAPFLRVVAKYTHWNYSKGTQSSVWRIPKNIAQNQAQTDSHFFTFFFLCQLDNLFLLSCDFVCQQFIHIMLSYNIITLSIHAKVSEWYAFRAVFVRTLISTCWVHSSKKYIIIGLCRGLSGREFSRSLGKLSIFAWKAK